MPLQNRVDPFGTIHETAARGLFMGNRGVIHDPATRTLMTRRWTSKAWIVCQCDFKGVRRDVMGRNAPSGKAGWTELFFLDEPTALAAGHRPCFYCRRVEARDFQARFPDGPMPAPEMDRRLHRERFAASGSIDVVSRKDLNALPDGSFVARGGEAFARHQGRWRPWRFSGYSKAVDLDGETGLALLTPSSTVAALANGYRPAWHPSIGA